MGSIEATRSVFSTTPVGFLLGKLGLSAADFRDLKNKGGITPLSFPIESHEHLLLLRSLIPRLEAEVGDYYAVICVDGLPFGVAYEDRLVPISFEDAPPELLDEYVMSSRGSALEEYGIANGLIRYSSVYEPSGELLECVFFDGCERFHDLGCGAALLSIKGAQLGIDCTASDLNPLCLVNAEYNLSRAGVRDRVALIRSDLFENLAGEKFDVIACFPPVADEWHKPRMPLDPDAVNFQALAVCDLSGDMVARIMRQAGEHLRPGGTLQMLQCPPFPQRPDDHGLIWDRERSKTLPFGAGHYERFLDFSVYRKQ